MLQEIEYNRDNNVDADLPELDESKTLNQREVKRELKHLLELMSDRDQWESERRVQQVKAIVDTRKKKNTIAGKKLEAQKYEEIERQRLLNKSSLDANTSINFEVDHGPRLPGLSGFGMFRKQKQQIREYNKRKQAKEKLERNKLLSRNSSMSSTGSIKPLTTVLEKQSRGSARGKAQASAQAKAFDEINGDGQERDLNSDSFVKRLPGATERSLLAESLDIYDDEDDFVFAKPNETSVPRGYVKANTLRLMKEVYKQQSNLINTSNSMFKELNAQVKVSFVSLSRAFSWAESCALLSEFTHVHVLLSVYGQASTPKQQAAQSSLLHHQETSDRLLRLRCHDSPAVV